MYPTSTPPQSSPALRLLHPAARRAIGSIAAASALALGYLVFGPASDARSVQIALGHGSGSASRAGATAPGGQAIATAARRTAAPGPLRAQLVMLANDRAAY